MNWDFFHKVVYINLKKRTDRNITLKKGFREIGINESKLVRFNAIENELGYIGCTQSHISVIKMVRENNWPNVLILEDDIRFIKEPSMISTVNEYIAALQHIRWDVAFLAANYRFVSPLAGINYLVRAIHAWCASAYTVNQHYYDALIENYEQGLDALLNDGVQEIFALDCYWALLM